MSDFGQAPPPPPSYDPTFSYAQPLKDRPTAVTVLGIIGIIWAILNMLCVGYTLAGTFLTTSTGKSLYGPAVKLPHWMMIMSTVQGLIGMVLCVMLLVGCIGAMYLRKWARSLVIAWLIATLLVATVSTILQIVFLPITVDAIKQSQPNNPALNQAQGMMQWIMIGSTVFVWVIACILPFCFLLIWNKPTVKEAFEENVQA